MASRSTVGVVILASLIVLASSAVPKISKRQAANPTARIAEDAKRDAEIPQVADFACPNPGDILYPGSFSRYAHPENCRIYYMCSEGVAREYACPIGTVFNIGDADGTGNCKEPEDVPGCEDYYGEQGLEAIRESGLLAGFQSNGQPRVAPPKQLKLRPQKEN